MRTRCGSGAAVALGVMLVVGGCAASGDERMPQPTPSVAEVVGEDPAAEEPASGHGVRITDRPAGDDGAGLGAASPPTWLERMAQRMRAESGQQAAARCVRTQRLVNPPLVRVVCVDWSR